MLQSEVKVGWGERHWLTSANAVVKARREGIV